MIEEQELTRDFCPKCCIKVEGIVKLFCHKCSNDDLIPEPISFTKEESDLIIGAIPLQALPKEEIKSAIEIDPEIIKRVLDSNFLFITGLAGSGKSTLIREIDRLHPGLIELTSTTGIAAINLGGKTINSTLKYFNTESLRRIWESGFLQMHLRKVRQFREKLVIEEISMMDANALDYIIDAVDEINGDMSGKKLGIILVGDNCQLPPIKAPFVFKSKFWDRFENNTLKLTKIWRQDNLDFIDAINLVRKGDGKNAVVALQACGVTFSNKLEEEFDGTTLITKNDGVDVYNNRRLALIDSPIIRITPTRRGKQLGEWEKNIPYELRLKIGAYVMILSNDSPMFSYVNGDVGTIETYESGEEAFGIRLKRNGKLVKIKAIVRQNLSESQPEHSHFSSMFTPYIDNMTQQWVLGTIKYIPLRLAYASTCHKLQGLSLEKLQIDSRDQFFGSDNLAYVAISRCRTPQGLTIIGQPSHVASKIRVSKEVLKYI